MPPPVTPSPHRFVIKKQPPPRRPPLVQEQTPRPSQQQFNATPRFNFSSTPRPTPSQNAPASTPAVSRYLTPARLRQEEIIDNSPDASQEEVQQSIETEHLNHGTHDISEDSDNEYQIEEEPLSKRRKLSSSPLLLDDLDRADISDAFNSSPIPILSSPPAPRGPVSRNTPRFLLSTPGTPSTPHLPSTQPVFLKPPRFRPPDPAEPATQADPLPEQFSPHRRGQKYLPGGLASEVRDWLMNIESSTSATGRKDEGYLVRLVIDEVSGGARAGMTLVRGRKVVEAESMIDVMGEVGVLLAGEGAGTGLQKGRTVEVGRTVGIKGPVWEIVVEGEKWGVGVEWKVLDDQL